MYCENYLWRHEFSMIKFASGINFRLLSICIDRGVLIAHIQEEVLWYILFANSVNTKFKRFQETIKSIEIFIIWIVMSGEDL